MTVRPTPISRTKIFADMADIVRQVPDVFAAAQVPLLKQLAPQVLAMARAGVPVRKGPRQLRYRYGGDLRPAGGLVSLLDAKVDEQARRLTVGLLTPQARSKGFYGWILDAGRGMRNTVSRARVRRLKPKIQGPRASLSRFTRYYSRAISPIPPGRYDITFGRVRYSARALAGPILLKAFEQTVFKLAWNKIMGR